MWDKVKEYGLWVFSGIAAIAAGVFYFLFKKKEADNVVLQAKDQLHEADKQSTLLDKDIQQKQQENQKLQEASKQTAAQIAAIEKQRTEAAAKEKSRPADQVEDYWNKK